MLNPGRIKLMTALAMYETGEGKKDIKISSYAKNDYVSLHVLTTVIAVTVAYLLIAIIFCALFMGLVVNSMNMTTLYLYGMIALVVYAIIVIVTIIYGRIYYSKKYKLAKLHTKSFYKGLKSIENMYHIEEQNKQDSIDINDLRKQLKGE